MTYPDLISGRVTLRDFYRMLRILDWNQYAQGRANALARAEQRE